MLRSRIKLFEINRRIKRFLNGVLSLNCQSSSLVIFPPCSARNSSSLAILFLGIMIFTLIPRKKKCIVWVDCRKHSIPATGIVIFMHFYSKTIPQRGRLNNQSYTGNKMSLWAFLLLIPIIVTRSYCVPFEEKSCDDECDFDRLLRAIQNSSASRDITSDDNFKMSFRCTCTAKTVNFSGIHHRLFVLYTAFLRGKT